VYTGTPSSIAASQSSSIPLHASAAPGWIPGLASSQSVPSVTYPAGTTPPQVETLAAESPYPSPSASRYANPGLEHAQ